MNNQEDGHNMVWINGKWEPGQQVSFNATMAEPWTEYMTEGGTTLRVRSVVTAVYRMAGHNPDGSPAYLVKTSPPMIDTQSPSDLYSEPPPSGPTLETS